MSTLNVYDAAREFPERDALIVAGQTFTWEDMDGILAPIMIELLDRGVTPGSNTPIAFIAEPTLDTLQRLYCLITAGVPAWPIHPSLTERERSMLLDRIAPIKTTERDRRRSDDDPPLARGSLNFPDVDGRDERPLAVVHTSGSTGVPKGVILSRRAFVWSARASEANLGWQDDDRWLLRIPVAHIGGLSTVTRCLLARRCLVLADDDLTLTEQIERDRVTLVSLVPTQLRRLIDAQPDWRPPAHLRAVLLGGAHAPADLLADAADRGWPVLTTYGLTEACSQVATQPPGTVNRGELGSGRPLPGVDVRIVDDVIQVRGPMQFSGYFPTDGRPAFTPDGWFPTGDRGRIDEDGYLHVLGRVHDLIVTGGENVDPVEVENALRACDGIADAYVFGMPDREWGERVVALVVPTRSTPDAAALDAALRERLAPFKLPRRYAFVDRLPLTPAGKPDRRAAARALQTGNDDS